MVQLPQSLTFSNPDKMHQDQQTVNAMPQGMLTLFARQQESMAYAQQHYKHAAVEAGPDLAFSLGPLMPGEQLVDVLFLMRADKEAYGSEAAAVKAGTARESNATYLAARQGATPHGGGATTSDGHNHASSSADDGAGAVGGTAAAAAAALQQLAAEGVSYEMREWEFAHENYTKEVSRVSNSSIGGVCQ